MPLPTSVDKKEYFEIQDFIAEQNMKIVAQDWRTLINRNKIKLQAYWKRWHGRNLTNKELWRLASGSVNPLNQRTAYRNQIKSFQKRQAMYTKQGQKAKAKKVGQSIKAIKTSYGKPLQTLIKEYQEIKQYEAAKYGITRASGYNIPSVYGGK